MVEQNDPKGGGLAWPFRFDRLAKGGQSLRVNAGHSLLSRAAGSLSEEGRLG